MPTKAVFDTSPDGIFVADAEDRYLDVNDAACELLRTTRAELVGRTALDLVAPADAAALAAHLGLARRDGAAQFETVLRRGDGTTVPVDVHTRCIAGGLRYSVVRDISARRQREEEARRDREVLERVQEINALHLDDAPDAAIYAAALDAAMVIDDADGGVVHGVDDDGALREVARRGAPIASDDPAVRATLLASRSGTQIGLLLTRARAAPPASDAVRRRLELVARHAADVLAHRLDERRARRAETLAAGILAVSADAIIAIDPDGRILEWNPSAEAMFGYPRAEALAMSLGAVLPRAQRAVHRQHVAEFAHAASGARRMAHPRATGRRKDGHEFPVDATISRLEVDGALVLTVAVRDVSEQRRLEDEQRVLAELGGALASADYEETLQRVVQVTTAHLSDFASLFIIGEPERELRRAAAAARDPELAWAVDTVMDLPLAAPLTHPALTVFRERRSVVLALEPAQYPALALNPAHLRALEAVGVRSVLMTPLVATGDALGVLVMSRREPAFDDQDVRLAEAMARRCGQYIEHARLYRAEQRATRARDEVLQIVAHDLRNPLNSMSLQLQRLMRQREDRVAPWPEAAQRMAESSARMNELIQDLLDVARLEAGALSMVLGPLAVARVVDEALAAQQALAAAAEVELRRDVPDDLPAMRGDHRRLLQVLQNLLGNALRHTAAGGTITVGASAVPGAVELHVADTGSGIAPDHLAHVFDRFWQADHRDRRGAGLGLAIVRGIVEAHGGRIRIESAPGEGTTVFVRIPAAP